MADRDERIRVVVLLDSLRRPGGGESLAIEGAIRLDPERFDRTLCLSRWEDDFERIEPARTILARFEEEGVRIVRLHRSSWWAVWSWVPLIRFLRRARVEVIHGHLFGSNVWACVVGTVARVPAIVAHEHMWAYTGRPGRALLDRRMIAPLSDAFIAVSREGRRQMLEEEKIPERDIVLIPNGIPSLPGGDGSRVRAEFNIPDSAPIIGSVGHLRPEKAFDVLIEAFAEIRNRNPKARLLIAGEGSERGKLEDLRHRLGLEDSVLLPGARSDVPDLLDAIDVAVCCSDFEGGPLSVMEYMGAALPVVGTRVGGLPELVDDQRTGLLVEPRDPAALAEAVCALLDDPERAREMGAAGKELRDSEYDISTWVGRLEDLYTRLLGRAA